jgi:hypothetical protein
LLGSVEIGRDVVHKELSTGSVEVEGPISGEGAAPAIVVGRDLLGWMRARADVGRHIQIGGDVVACEGMPAIMIDGHLTRQLRICGSLVAVEGVASEIVLNESMFFPGAIIVNWDVGPLTDDGLFRDHWQSGAVISIKNQPYYGNTYLDRVYEVACPKGDLNNSGATDNFDITPFVLGLAGYGPGSGYDTQYPGLAQSALYHGDCDCQLPSAYNNFDITAFMLKLTDPGAYHDQYGCEACPEPPGGDGLEQEGSFDSATVAALLQEYLDPELLPFLIRVGEDIIANSSDDAEAAFWVEVLAELE